MSESTLDPSSPQRSENTETGAQRAPEAARESSASQGEGQPEGAHEEVRAGERPPASDSSEGGDATSDTQASKRRRRRKRKRRGAAAAESNAEQAEARPQDARTADMQTSATPGSTPVNKDKTGTAKANTEKSSQRKKKRSPQPRTHGYYGRTGYDDYRSHPALEKLARWRWAPPSHVLRTSAAQTLTAEVDRNEAQPTTVTAPDNTIAAGENTNQGATSESEHGAIQATLEQSAPEPHAPDDTVQLSDSPPEPADSSAHQSSLDAPPAEPATDTEATKPAADTDTTEPATDTEATKPDTEATKPDTEATKPAARPHDAERSKAFAIPEGDTLAGWLEAVLEVCPSSEHPATWVGLFSHPGFRSSFGALSEQQQQQGYPFLVAYEAIFLDVPPSVGAPASTQSSAAPPTTSEPPTSVAPARTQFFAALTRLLDCPAQALRSWPVNARERLIEFAASFEVPNAHSDATTELFPDAPRASARVRLAQVCDTLARGRYTEAKELLESLRQQPLAPSLLPVLHGALEGQRFGNVVIMVYGGANSRGSDPKAPKRHSGFCLESQRDVWLRVGETQDAASFERHSQVYRRALIPGVVGLYTFGITRSRKPYLSVLRRGLSLDRRISHHWGLSRQATVRLATEVALVASSLCRAGVRMPDLATRRFEVDESDRLWLSDLWGAEPTEPKAQDATAVEQCRACLLELMQLQPGFELPKDWQDVLSHAADFETLMATLRTLDRSRFWRD